MVRHSGHWLEKMNRWLLSKKSTILATLKEQLSGMGWGVMKTAWIQIGLITVLGAMLRLFGVLHGLQENFLYHPDTNITLNEVWSKFLGQDWLSGSYNGAFYNLFLSHMIGIIENLIRFLGYSPAAWSIGQISSIASLLSVILGTATIPIVYLVGRHAYNKTTGVLAALFLSLCPLHTFHSHYPYRDIPMVFFLTLTLLLCIRIIKKPTLLNLILVGLAAILTVGMKPAGLVILVPLVIALIMASYRAGRRWWIFIPVGVIIVWGLVFFAQGGVSSRFTTPGEIIAFLLENQEGIFLGMAKEVIMLNQWLGLPFLLASLVGMGYGFWRRSKSDILLLTFLIIAFLAAASYLWLDERFLVFLMPAMTVMLGRLIVDIWRACFKRRILKTAIFLVVTGLFFNAFMESTWQGILFSLPDTRAVSGRWLEAHFPMTIRVSTDQYYPIGLNLWPNVSLLNFLQPLDKETAKTDLLVTSSLMDQRFLVAPSRYPKASNFYSSLQRERPLIKKISLGSHGFIHSDIGIYSPYPVSPHAPHLLLPRPYDSKWNFGLSFLDQGPFDRDDRTIQLGWGHRYTATLVSPISGQEIVVFMLNGPTESVVKVRVGSQTKIRTLKPGEFHILTFRPKWFFPKKPALYYFETGQPQGEKCLVQLRCGNREIGEAFAKWGLYEQALPYLKRAIADNDPYHSELYLLLGIVQKELGQTAEARKTIGLLINRDSHYIKIIRSLGQSDSAIKNWDREFREFIGLNPSLLSYALSQEFKLEELFPGRSGKVEKDCRASGGQSLIFEKVNKPDEVMFGPFFYLDQGHYFAGFFFRIWDMKETKPFAILKVLADNHVISTLSVRAKDLEKSGGFFREVKMPFSHLNPRAELKFQVLATGHAGFAIEKIQIEPDLQQLFKEKLLGLKSIIGTLP